MSFKFNFSSDEDDGEEEEKKTTPSVAGIALDISSDGFQGLPDVPVQDLFLEDSTRITYVQSQMVEKHIKQRRMESLLTAALDENSDLVPNVYEGGLKVWECSLDLAHYLSSLSIAFRGLKVLELGCGAGLPGIFCLLKGATVHFQDYNREVLEYITIPNVRHNCSKDDRDLCRFLSGDWASVQHLLSSDFQSDEDRYDIILTSETIYSPANYKKLHDTMQNLLKPSGMVYLAAKTYYFGVGGGLREFEEKIKQWDAFTIHCVKAFTEGVQREIMMLRFKAPNTT